MKLAPTIAGFPDRLVILPMGRIYLVEMKSETGRLRPVQRVWLERAAERGVQVVVLHGKREVDEWLKIVL